MLTYRSLNQDFIESIQEGRLDRFIKKLNQVLLEEPRNYLVWLFIARANDAIGDVDNAYNSYAFLLRIADPKLPKVSLLKEIDRFVNRCGHSDLLDIAKEKFGHIEPPPSRLSDSSSSNISASPKQISHKNTSPLREPSKLLLNQSSKIISSKRSLNNDTRGNDYEVKENNRDVPLDARRAFDNGDLKTACEKLREAIQSGNRSPQNFLMLAQTLQRLQQYDDALQVLDQGIQSADHYRQVSLRLLRAQILHARHQWKEAAEAYEDYIRVEKRPAARRFSRLQLARIYARIGDHEEAKVVLKGVLHDYPQDQVALNLQAALERPFIPKPLTDSGIEYEAESELAVDLPDEGIDLISPMLRRDLASADFRDEKILLQGGQPEVEDAIRLLEKADQTKGGSEFGERYPFFLEAAKAFNELSEGSYPLGRFYWSLTRYAMLKGGAYVLEMRRQILSGQSTLPKLRQLRDSAISYYLEALALQVRVDVSYVLIPLANYLRAQLFYKLISRNEQIPDEILKYKFAELFKYCLSDSDDEVKRIAYASVVAWGAASANVWNRIQNLPGGAGGIGSALERIRRERPYKILSEITGKSYSIEQRPSEVLQLAFLERRRQVSEIHNFLFQFQQLALIKENLRELYSKWKTLPDYQNALLDTDNEVRDGISSILTILLPYNDRSAEERTGILFTARIHIDTLLRFIRENPTNWGRVGFEPLLTRWQVAIREIEKRRLSEIQPKIVARLEPPIFRIEDNSVQGGFILSNEGRGTAEGVKLEVQLYTYDTKEIVCELTDKVDEEIKALEGTYHYFIQIEKTDLREGVDVPYRLRVGVTPIFAGAELETTEQEFTFEIGSGAAFSVDNIPWNEVRIPPEQLFKGREQFIRHLVDHFTSSERNKTYILYGLTRTGKTSILHYLGKELDLKTFTISGETYRFVSFEWEMQTAASHSNAADMWRQLLLSNTVSKLERFVESSELTDADVPYFSRPETVRFKHWEEILLHLQQRRIYPIFLIDEFSAYRTLVDNRRIDSSFLAAIRNFAISGKASFIFAGTYDLRKLIKDPTYGITGQFVNAIEVQVSRIAREPAINLIRVMEPKLMFTQDAIEQLLHLSYCIPYFVQLICKNCAFYAMNTGRSIIGFPEVETVVRILTGDAPPYSGITSVPAGQFGSNVYTPQDPVAFEALLSTICDLTRGQIHPRMVTYAEIQEVWDKHGVKLFQARLAEAIQELQEREILITGEDEGDFAYRISVDLFRRWWANERKNLKLELDKMKQEA